MSDEITDPVDELFKDLEEPKDEEKEKEEPKEKKEDTVDINDLKADWDKERQGLLKAAKSERYKRQDMKKDFDNLSTTVNTILQQRQAAENVDTKRDDLPVEFAEDGDSAFVKSNLVDDKVESLLAPLQTKIEQLEAALQSTVGASEGQRKAQESIEAIVGEDERYTKVYNKYKPARQWVNDQAIDFQRENDLSGVLTSGQVLDNVITPELEAEFTKKFPGLALVETITAGDSKRLFKGMLEKAADTLEELNPKPNKKDSSKFKQIINKPSGLGDSTNAKGAELSIVEKVGQLSTTDIMGLSDAQADALEKAMLNEEVSGGVEF